MASIKLTGRTFPPGTPLAFPVKNKIQEELRRKRINITGRKPQAASGKLQIALDTSGAAVSNKFSNSDHELSGKRQASSDKPQAASCWTAEPS